MPGLVAGRDTDGTDRTRDPRERYGSGWDVPLPSSKISSEYAECVLPPVAAVDGLVAGERRLESASVDFGDEPARLGRAQRPTRNIRGAPTWDMIITARWAMTAIAATATYDRNQGQPRNRNRDDDPGFFERAGEEIRSWFSDDDDQGRQHRDHRMQGDRFRYEDTNRYGERGAHNMGRGYSDPAIPDAPA